jgi:hypothetical protein
MFSKQESYYNRKQDIFKVQFPYKNHDKLSSMKKLGNSIFMNNVLVSKSKLDVSPSKRASIKKNQSLSGNKIHHKLESVVIDDNFGGHYLIPKM